MPTRLVGCSWPGNAVEAIGSAHTECVVQLARECSGGQWQCPHGLWIAAGQGMQWRPLGQCPHGLWDAVGQGTPAVSWRR